MFGRTVIIENGLAISEDITYVYDFSPNYNGMSCSKLTGRFRVKDKTVVETYEGKG